MLLYFGEDIFFGERKYNTPTPPLKSFEKP
jgi:hypothetical protein